MPRTHPPYAPEFRRQMIDLVRCERSAGELSREFGCASKTIRNWVRQADRDEGRGDDGSTPQEGEGIRRLRREVGLTGDFWSSVIERKSSQITGVGHAKKEVSPRTDHRQAAAG